MCSAHRPARQQRLPTDYSSALVHIAAILTRMPPEFLSGHRPHLLLPKHYGNDDGRMHFWNTSGGETSIVSTHNDLTSLALSTDGTLLAAAGSNGIVQIWQVTDQSLIRLKRMQFQEGGASSAAFSPDGGRITAGSEDGSIRIWFINPSTTKSD